jgi:F0F1-type ATP synthase assembly protein I
MKQAAATPTTKSVDADAPMAVGILAMTFLDTTWRMATPVILCTIVGIMVDRRFGTKPWVTLPSVVVGFGLSVLLVKRQLAAVQRAEDKKK